MFESINALFAPVAVPAPRTFLAYADDRSGDMTLIGQALPGMTLADAVRSFESTRDSGKFVVKHLIVSDDYDPAHYYLVER
jgi:hypothetical protein